MRRLLALGTDVILPLECGRQLSCKESPENVLRELAKITSGQLVVTDGANGSWGLKDGSIIHQPAIPVSGKIDSTGCGDAFHAGYVAGLLEGWPLEERMEFGASLASLVIGHVGGRTALPKRRDLAKIFPDEMSYSLRKLLIQFSEQTQAGDKL
jgi:sugar/nucleoside kinase (ribokinase family)